MNILVTGGAGYLGSVLVPKLLVRGHCVRVLDVGYFGVGHLRSMRTAVELIREDIRLFCEDRRAINRLLDDLDCVIHLAAISNDPSAELDPALTHNVNFRATQAVADAAKARGIRFIFSSSCSVYGEALDEIDEEAQVHPCTTYAHSKVDSDRYLNAIATSDWRPVVLRNGTLFGYSPRMRFDLVVNIFAFMSTLYNEVKVFGDGEQWRPFLHVHDAARAFVTVLQASPELVSGEIFNVGDYRLNLQLSAVSKKIAAIVSPVEIEIVENGDKRNYRVSFDKIHTCLGFVCEKGVEFGIREIFEAVQSRQIVDFTASQFNNQLVTQLFAESASADQSSMRALIKLAV